MSIDDDRDFPCNTEVLRPKHVHDFRFAYSEVQSGSYIYDKYGYIYDILYCSSCGTRKEVYRGQEKRPKALELVNQRNSK